jgi:N-acetylglucosaminyldiphosphoundecaprenol N-acetyl-beta-D-mannosaminyltransferase
MLIKKIKILNYKISIITLNSFNDKLKKFLKFKKKSYICVSAVHGAVESFYNNKYKISHDKADIAVPDGRPIYWALKLLGNSKVDHLPGYFVTNEICKLANKKKYKIGIYGSTDDVQQKFIKNIKKKYKKIKFTYLFSPPFRKLSLKETNNICKEINKSRVDILFVALGAPKQEIWMYDNYKKINCVSIGIGAAIDFISGNKKMAPHIMEFIGLAWLFRLISEPRRLFLRYFITNTLFLYFFTIQYIKFKLKIING